MPSAEEPRGGAQPAGKGPRILAAVDGGPAKSSRMEDIESGLVAFAAEIEARGIRSIAVPPSAVTSDA
jgi:hypothetical protein